MTWIMGIDPGGVTGYALWQNGKIVADWTGQQEPYPFLVDAHLWIRNAPDDGYLVVERYTITAATANPFSWGSANTVSASATTTLTNAYGCLLYDHTAGTPTDMGICYVSFNGGNTITLGTFTIVWAGGLIFSITL